MFHLEDILILENILECIDEPDEGRNNPGQIMTEAGKYFLEAAYEDRTLEQEGPESLIVNLRAFDCFSYVESCLALSLLIPTRRRTWNEFTALLTKIRYRGGILDGYASRLHYFSDWLHDNAQKGLLRDVTPDLKGQPYKKNISFMTKNPELYPPLSDAVIARQMAEVEKKLTDGESFFIPVSAFEQSEYRIKEGDIIGITTSDESLDVMHAGLALYQGEALHLLHASQQAGKVIISEETLGDYLRAKETRTGIMVGRLPA